MARKTLILSPHNDDTAYSVGGWLLRSRGEGQEVVSATVFSRSVFAPFAGGWRKIQKIAYRLARRDPADLCTRLRTAEDVQYCRTVHIGRMDLGLPEAPLRGNSPTTDSLFVESPEEVQGPWLDTVTSAISRAVESVKPDQVFLPAAIGRHVDHILVQKAFLRLGKSCLEAFVYEDLPYAGWIPEDEYRRELSRLALDGEVLTPLGDWLDRKMESPVAVRIPG